MAIYIPYTEIEFEEYLDKKEVFIKSGCAHLDKYFSLFLGEPCVIAGLSSHGKTSFMIWLTVMYFVHNPKSQFVYLPYEGSAGKLIIQMAATLFNHFSYKEKNVIVNSDLLEIKKFRSEAKKKASNERKIAIDFYRQIQSRLTVSEERFTINTLPDIIQSSIKQNPELKIIFLDYIQMLRFEKIARERNRQQELKEIMLEVMNICTKHNVSFINGCQMNNPTPTTKNAKAFVMNPEGSRESRDIYHNANSFVGVWNETKYCKDFKGVNNGKEYNECEVDIIKNRDDETVRGICYHFYPKYNLWIPAGMAENKIENEEEEF